MFAPLSANCLGVVGSDLGAVDSRLFRCVRLATRLDHHRKDEQQPEPGTQVQPAADLVGTSGGTRDKNQGVSCDSQTV